MSIQFNQPINAEAESFLEKAFGRPKITDGKTFLFDEMGSIHGDFAQELIRKAGQPMTASVDQIGDVKEVGGVKYKATALGWVLDV